MPSALSPFAVLAIALTIPLGLVLDSRAGAWGQPLADLWIWAAFGWLLWREIGLRRPAMIACLVIATLGECVLALVWGLYDYRLGNLPLFVPPGHVVLFWLGAYFSTRIPQTLLAWVPLFAIVAVSLSILFGHDAMSVLLLALYLLCWRFGPSPRLYSTMFVLALLLEFWGTAFGNWAWRPTMPGLGWSAANPPIAAGTFYCVLDLLVLVATGRRTSTNTATGANRSPPQLS